MEFRLTAVSLDVAVATALHFPPATCFQINGIQCTNLVIILCIRSSFKISWYFHLLPLQAPTLSVNFEGLSQHTSILSAKDGSRMFFNQCLKRVPQQDLLHRNTTSSLRVPHLSGRLSTSLLERCCESLSGGSVWLETSPSLISMTPVVRRSWTHRMVRELYA